MKSSTTRKLLLLTLRSLGYITSEFLLTPLQFGILNSRLHYYLLAKMFPLVFPHMPNLNADVDEVWRHIPGPGQLNHDWVDPRLQQCDECGLGAASHSVDEIRFYLDEALDEDETVSHLYAVPDRILQRWGRLFDIVLPSSRRTCCFTRGASPP
jgi:tRNA (cytosine38-C5)-methyltransferase